MKIYAILLVIAFICFKEINGFPTAEKSRGKYCKACNAFVSFATRLSQNNTDGILQNELIAICNDYSSLPGKQTKNMCAHIVNDVLKLFKNVNTTTFCDEISACITDGFDLKSIVKVTVTDNTTCQFCIEVVTNIREIVSGSQTELEVKGFVEDWCHYLGSFENECVSLSDEYLDQLFSYIRTTLQPKQVCSSLGACPSQMIHQKPKTPKLPELAEVINVFPPQMPLIPLQEAEPMDKGKNDLNCMLCKRIVKYIEVELEDNRTEAAIINALDHVCRWFPVADREKCISFVEEYTDELIHILAEETDPGMACALIGLCVPAGINTGLEREVLDHKESREWKKIEPSHSVSSTEQINKVNNISNDDLCYECEIILHFLQNEMYDYNNEERIEDYIENYLCEKIKVIIVKETCDSFVKKYAPAIMQSIAQKYLDPSLVCKQELKLCPNKSKTMEVTETDISQDVILTHATEKCDMCVVLVQQIDSLLENDEVDKELAQIVEKICFSLPKSKQQECESMIEAFAPYFLQMIGHLSDAHQICNSIDMCYTSGQTQLLGGHKCTFGPSYWCHTIAHANSCKATNFCRTKVWKAIP